MRNVVLYDEDSYDEERAITSFKICEVILETVLLWFLLLLFNPPSLLLNSRVVLPFHFVSIFQNQKCALLRNML
jgi:hypothetical protein